MKARALASWVAGVDPRVNSALGPDTTLRPDWRVVAEIRPDLDENRRFAEPAIGELRAVATMPCGVRTERPQEVDLAEVRPVDLAEVELRVGALPEQETGEALLP